MMYYLMVFWIIYGCILIYCLIQKKRKLKCDSNFIAFSVIVAVSFFIMGIITGDPLFSAIGVPKEYEWLAGLIISGFTAWRFYFDPLKKKVLSIENKFSKYFGITATKFDHIEKGIEEIKIKLN